MSHHKYRYKSINLWSISLTLFFALGFGCTKLVGVDPPYTSITGNSAYNSDATAASVMTGLYINMSQITYPSIDLISISRLAGLSADELQLYPGTSDFQVFYFSNTLNSPVPPANGGGGYELWSPLYTDIFTCNSAIEGASASNLLTPSVKNQLVGEAKFIRSYCYFYLVNFFGDVPLALSTDYKVNSALSRSPVALVYQQIISDLTSAKALLSPNFLASDLLSPTSERVRPTSWAASALLARVYLYTKNWDSASIEATTVINSPLFSLDSLNNVFLANSTEAIWQLQPVTGNENTQDGAAFVLPPEGPDMFVNQVYLSNSLLQDFEPNDQRKAAWVDSVMVGSDTFYFPYKYKQGLNTSPGIEYQMMLRLGELFLVRAEAYAENGKLNDALSDLNIIRTRAWLPNVQENNISSLVNIILHEKRIELFTEMGNRWLDMKRTGGIDSVMQIATPFKSGNPWQSFQQLYPLPYSDIQKDGKLSQNTGY